MIDHADLDLFKYKTSGAVYAEGDMDFDGDVDFNDFVSFAQRYGATLPDTPSVPYHVAAGDETDDSILVTWSAPSDRPFDGFRIYRSTDGTNFTFAHASGAAERSWDDLGLVDGTKYWYRIRSFTAAEGMSSVTPKSSAITLLTIPTELTVVQTSADTNWIHWINRSATAESVVIERQDTPRSSWVTVATVAAGLQGYSDAGAPNPGSSRYRLGTISPIRISIRISIDRIANLNPGAPHLVPDLRVGGRNNVQDIDRNRTAVLPLNTDFDYPTIITGDNDLRYGSLSIGIEYTGAEYENVRSPADYTLRFALADGIRVYAFDVTNQNWLPIINGLDYVLRACFKTIVCTP